VGVARPWPHAARERPLSLAPTRSLLPCRTAHVRSAGSPACRTAPVDGPDCWPSGAKTERAAAGKAAWCTPSMTVRRRSSSRRGCPPATCSRPVSRPHPVTVSAAACLAAAVSSPPRAQRSATRSRRSCARSRSPSRCSRSDARRSSVWVSARSRSWSAYGCPLRAWRALPGAGQPEGTWARLGAGPRCRAQAVSASSSELVAVLALQRPRIVRAALVTVSADCRTRVRSGPDQPAT